jgi:hypothetical protein
MLRQIIAEPRSPFAPRVQGAGAGAGPQRPRPPRGWGWVARVLVAPFAAAVAAIAGLVYVLLLPICGIASIASAVALASWSTLREVTRGAHRRAAPHP